MQLPKHLVDFLDSLGISLRTARQFARGANPADWLQSLWNFAAGRQKRKPAGVPPEFWRRLAEWSERGGAPTTRPAPSQPNVVTSRRSRRDELRPDRPDLSEFIDCSRQSSNVYGFQYDYRQKILFVAYQGHQLNTGALSRGSVRRGRSTSREQNIGPARGVMTGARGGRGATYAYHGVPAKVFDRMREATSKGKFVWDNLRVRGTIYGHQYRYTLAQGQVQPKNGGVYIPRKATKGGYRSRSLVDIGGGSFQTSTMKPRSFGQRTTRRGKR